MRFFQRFGAAYRAFLSREVRSARPRAALLIGVARRSGCDDVRVSTAEMETLGVSQAWKTRVLSNSATWELLTRRRASMK